MNILFLGAPGSGKGTQSKNIEDKFNIPQISTGIYCELRQHLNQRWGKTKKNYVIRKVCK